MFAALDARESCSIAVRPSQSLVNVAARELDSHDRWPELAKHNGTGDQLKLDDVFSIEVPAR